MKPICSSLGCFFSLALVSSIASPSFGEIVITEVMYNPVDENAWEWIEVVNRGPTAVDLSGYVAFNLGDPELPTPLPAINPLRDPDTVIGAGEVAVIYDGFLSTNHPSNFDDGVFRQAWGLPLGVKLIGAEFFPSMSNVAGSSGQSIGFWASDADWRLDLTPVEVDPVNNPGVYTNRTTSLAHAVFGLDFSSLSFPEAHGDSSIAWNGKGSNQVGGNWVESTSGLRGGRTSVPATSLGSTNNVNDVGSPGVVPPGVPGVPGLYITEVMYDPASAEDDWEWIELYNSTGAAIDLSGYVLDDNNGVAVSSANITEGMIPAGSTGILFNATDLSSTEFASAWGASLNLIAVTEWEKLTLNNTGDQVSLWDSYTTYSGNHQTHANAIVTQSFLEANGFPTTSNSPSISWVNLESSPAIGSNWRNSVPGDGLGSFNPSALPGFLTLHPGGDIGSPGSVAHLVPEPAAIAYVAFAAWGLFAQFARRG